MELIIQESKFWNIKKIIDILKFVMYTSKLVYRRQAYYKAKKFNNSRIFLYLLGLATKNNLKSLYN